MQTNNPESVICDIDGTVSVVSPSRAEILDSENPDWDKFYEDSFDDEPVEKVCRLVRHLSRHYHVIFCTSRRDTVREKTEQWLRSNLAADSFPQGWTLLMRQGADPRPDTLVKPELLSRHLIRSAAGVGEVLCILEDSAEMVKRWSDLGYTVIKVA